MTMAGPPPQRFDSDAPLSTKTTANARSAGGEINIEAVNIVADHATQGHIGNGIGGGKAPCRLHRELMIHGRELAEDQVYRISRHTMAWHVLEYPSDIIF